MYKNYIDLFLMDGVLEDERPGNLLLRRCLARMLNKVSGDELGHPAELVALWDIIDPTWLQSEVAPASETRRRLSNA